MFDTHCHLNFKRFRKTLDEVVSRSFETGVTKIVIPGTDVISSKKAVEIAERYKNIYAAVGIHPHHAYEIVKHETLNMKHETLNMKHETLNMKHETLNSKHEAINADIKTAIKERICEIEELLQHLKIVAIGEVGMDRHMYESTKYEEYFVDEKFIEIQRELLTAQIQLAITYNKSLILHNREAQNDLLSILESNWNRCLVRHAVFHCCEADYELLDFAKKHDMFIGVDGDVTYDKKKQDFIKKIPLEMLVVETDSPFILPEPLLSQKKYPNEPANILYVIKAISKLKGDSSKKVIQTTMKNGKILFDI